MMHVQLVLLKIGVKNYFSNSFLIFLENKFFFTLSNFMNLIKENEESKKNLHDEFHKQLERSEEKFKVIAEYLGKGLFNKVTLVTDN